MASFTYNDAASKLTALDASDIDWVNDTIKARLVASSVTPNKDDTSMTGYTAIGTDQTVGTKSINKDTTNDRIQYRAAASTWSAVAGGSTVGYVVYYRFITDDAGSTPIFCIDVADTATNGGDLSYTPDATNGVGYLQQ